MKLFTKIALVLASVLLIFGLLFSAIGFKQGVAKAKSEIVIIVNQFRESLPLGLGNLIGSSWINTNVIHDIQTFQVNEVESIQISSLYGEIVFEGTEGDAIEVLIDAPADYAYTCEAINGVLDFKDMTEQEVFKNRDITITFKIPYSMTFSGIEMAASAGSIHIGYPMKAADLTVSMDAGQFDTTEKITAGTASFTISAGQIQIDEIEADSLMLFCDVGNMSLSGSINGDLTAETRVGEIELILTGEESDFNYEVSRTLGSVYINGEEPKRIARDYTINNKAEKTMTLQCEIGSIEVVVEN
ncbi:MAG: DUF4097 family beta strand repeat-containing protein [Lachnospiraceae bacterium]